jgi:mannosyltransferase OCH1-like enzyme
MIPKNIFQSWYTKILDASIQSKIDSMKSMNPSYNYYLYDDLEMDDFVNNNFPSEITECYNKLNIIVAKVDFWRYLVIYKYGGVYLDMDSSIDRPLDEIIKENDQAIITAENNAGMFVQWAIIFNKEHPILKRVINLVIRNIRQNKYPNDIHKMTGPTVFSEAIQSIHTQCFNRNLRHNLIHKGFDVTFSMNDISYRVYSIDYNNLFTFKHENCDKLYLNKKSWRDEEKEINLLK